MTVQFLPRDQQCRIIVRHEPSRHEQEMEPARNQEMEPDRKQGMEPL